MPYKDPAAQKAAQKRHYEAKKDRYREVQRRLRQQAGYRDAEYAKRRAKAAAERALRPPKPPKAGPVRSAQSDRKAAVSPREQERKRTPEEEALHIAAQEYAEQQRRMKAAALARLNDRGQI